jgi:integrase
LAKATKVRKISKKRPVLRKTGQSGKTDKLLLRTPRPYTRNPDSQYLTQSEVKALFSVIKSPREICAFRLMLHRGLRASEVGLLQLSDWNAGEGLLHVRRAKNCLSQDYSLLPVEVSALRAWLKIRGNAPGPLFPSQKGPRAGNLGIHRNRLDQMFREYCALAGLREEKRHLHILRHSCATFLLDRGESLEDIRDWLSHRGIVSTARYAHYTARRRAEAAARQKDWR